MNPSSPNHRSPALRVAGLHVPVAALRYLLVGGTAYVVEMASLWALVHGAGVRPLYGVAISFWIGFAVAFVLQKLVAFQNFERGARALGRQLAAYSVLVAWNYIFTLACVGALQRVWPVFVTRTLVIMITTVWNFLVYRRIFRIRQAMTDGR